VNLLCILKFLLLFLLMLILMIMWRKTSPQDEIWKGWFEVLLDLIGTFFKLVYFNGKISIRLDPFKR
jgi:hypothetical protein